MRHATGSHFVRSAALFTAAVLLASSCASDGAEPGQPTTSATTQAGSPDTTLVAATTNSEVSTTTESIVLSDVTLYVSNQSFEDDPVGITVMIDGEFVVDDTFFVEGQHTWAEFTLELAAGSHEFIARSSTGVEHAVLFEVIENEPLWAVLNYWSYTDEPPRKFTFDTSDEPIYFA